MKLKIAIVFMLSLLVFAACKKTPAPFAGVKINVIKDFRSGAVSTYTYNADGTVSQIVKSGVGKTTFGYSGDTVIMSNINNASVTTDGFIYVMNSSGYAISSKGIVQNINNSSTCSYDANGVLDQQKYYLQGALVSQDDYTKGNNDITVIKHANFNNNTSTYDYYTYFTSNTNTIGVQNKGLFYLGVSSANLVQTDIQINNAGDTTNVITYKYRFDGNSNVDTLVSYGKTGQLIDSIGYIYY